MPQVEAQYMDAAVAEPPNPAVGYVRRSIEERVSVLEGTITNQNRIFDMLREGQQNLRGDIAGLRAETHTSLGELRDDMDKRFGEVDARIVDMDVRINERINETNERIVTMELGVNERIADMDVRTNERIADMDVRINERINETNERIATMELGVNERIADMDVRLRTKIDSNLKWVLGVQIAMWVTIIAAVLL